ncbi:hypothetical protein TNCT_289631 [Trichonephila clavata]|uniref:Uncharacterized protein n=1 Tax=Trichonephila clavata TaxID=2740835 RepID=A0A8X6G2E3_TRICU|nr:hypothetical protein TNCT_289631 [Trichonephila clavata]
MSSYIVRIPRLIDRFEAGQAYSQSTVTYVRVTTMLNISSKHLFRPPGVNRKTTGNFCLKYPASNINASSNGSTFLRKSCRD